jgi:hypothetical protein
MQEEEAGRIRRPGKIHDGGQLLTVALSIGAFLPATFKRANKNGELELISSGLILPPIFQVKILWWQKQTGWISPARGRL